MIISDIIKKAVDTEGGVYIVETLGGCMLKLTYDEKFIFVEDESDQVATVTIADVFQSNGVIHVIDKVLLPTTI